MWKHIYSTPVHVACHKVYQSVFIHLLPNCLPTLPPLPPKGGRTRKIHQNTAQRNFRQNVSEIGINSKQTCWIAHLTFAFKVCCPSILRKSRALRPNLQIYYMAATGQEQLLHHFVFNTKWILRKLAMFFHLSSVSLLEAHTASHEFYESVDCQTNVESKTDSFGIALTTLPFLNRGIMRLVSLALRTAG